MDGYHEVPNEEVDVGSCDPSHPLSHETNVLPL